MVPDGTGTFFFVTFCCVFLRTFKSFRVFRSGNCICRTVPGFTALHRSRAGSAMRLAKNSLIRNAFQNVLSCLVTEKMSIAAAVNYGREMCGHTFHYLSLEQDCCNVSCHRILVVKHSHASWTGWTSWTAILL